MMTWLWKFARSPKSIKYISQLYAPLLGAGIRISKFSSDFKEMEVHLKMSRYNKNMFGTHFGGSIFSLTDPYYSVMLLNILGRHYMVRDKSACIEFLKPGKTDLRAEFKVSDELVEEIIEKTSDGSPLNLKFDVDIVDKEGEVVARVDKTVYVRKKKGR